jgi:hypothetical protein
MANVSRAEASQGASTARIQAEALIGRDLSQKIAHTKYVWNIIPSESIFSTFRNLRQYAGNELLQRQLTVLDGANYLYHFRNKLRLSFPLSEETTTLPELVRLDSEVQRRVLIATLWIVVTNSCSGQKNSSAHKCLKHIESAIFGYTYDGLLSRIHQEITCNPSLTIAYSDLRDAFYQAAGGEHHIAMRALLSLAEVRKIDLPTQDLIDWVSRSSGYIFRTAKEVLESIQDPERFHLLAVAALMGSKCKPGVVKEIMSLMEGRKQKFTEEELKSAIAEITASDAPFQNKDLCIGMLQSASTKTNGPKC